MNPGGRRRLHNFLVSSVIASAATVLAIYSFGPRAGALTGCVGLLAVAYASDDSLGTCMIWAVLLLVALIVILMAFAGAVLVSGS